MEMNMLHNKLKETYKLSEDELSLLMYFIQTKGHSLRIYDIIHHGSLHRKELDGKNMHEIVLGLSNKGIITCSSEVYTLTGKLLDDIKDISIPFINVAIGFEVYKGAKNAMQSLNDIFRDDKILFMFFWQLLHIVFLVSWKEGLENNVKRFFLCQPKVVFIIRMRRTNTVLF